MKQMTIEKTTRKEYKDNLTIHADIDRKRRLIYANELIHREHAKLSDSFSVDCGHKNGKEIHNVYTNGIIKIYNARTTELVTILIGTEAQVRRYYKACGIEKYVACGMIELAKKHTKFYNRNNKNHI